MLKSYLEIREWLESFIPEVYSRKELGLGRIENLLSKLGNPHKKFKSIHIAGTSGKGSTAFYVARLLGFSGYKVGLHVSPHLIYIGERMQILEREKGKGKREKNLGNEIPVKRLVGLVNEIKPVVDEIKSKQPHLTPSYFEILVALSFLYFAKEKVDFAVVEVGLGGRLDATNVLLPEISVITNIGLDHTELLGDTVEKIALEKAGIIKTHVPVVTGASGIALKVIEKVAKSKNTLLINIYTQGIENLQKIDVFRYIIKPNDIDSHIPYYVNLECALLAILAVLAVKMPLSGSTIKRAFSVQFPGRFEEIEQDIILDGAHNPDKIRALIEFIWHSPLGTGHLYGKNESNGIILVLASKNGKNWKGMIDLLLKNLPITKVIATEYQSVTDTGFGSVVAAEEIAHYVLSIVDSRSTIVEIKKNSQEAVMDAIGCWPFAVKTKSNGKGLKANGLVLVTGSLYLVGEARTLWKLPSLT